MSLQFFFSIIHLGLFSAKSGYDPMPQIQNHIGGLVNTAAQNKANTNTEASVCLH